MHALCQVTQLLFFRCLAGHRVETATFLPGKKFLQPGDFRVRLKQWPNIESAFTLLVLGIELDLRNLHNRP